jgi:hypothetical protein
MMNILSVLLLAVVWLSPAFAAEGTFPVEEGFLNIGLDQMTQTVEVEGGVDLGYTPDGTIERLVNYGKIMVDQPEIWLDKDSEYRGMKPDNAKAIADMIRERLTENVTKRGYEVVEAPGPDTLYMRLALTDLYLKKKKRGVLTFTPVGRVAHIGAELMMEMMSKVDIVEMALQVELLDSQSEEVLAAMVVKRGARKDKSTGQELERMDFDEFRAVLQQYAARFACRLDNAKLPEAQQVDCMGATDQETAG